MLPRAHRRGNPGGEVIESLVRFFTAFYSAWEDYRYVIKDATAIGDDRVIAHGAIRAEGRASGVALEGDAYHRFWLWQDAECDRPGVAWRDAINVMFGGEATMYQGHDAVRELFRDLYGSFAEIAADYWDVRDLGERAPGLGHLHMRGTGDAA